MRPRKVKYLLKVRRFVPTNCLVRVGHSGPGLVERKSKRTQASKKGGSALPTCCLGGGATVSVAPATIFLFSQHSEPSSPVWGNLSQGSAAAKQQQLIIQSQGVIPFRMTPQREVNSILVAFHPRPQIASDLGRNVTRSSNPHPKSQAIPERERHFWLMAADSNRNGPQPAAI